MNDGIYFEVFAIKDGKRYNQKIINVSDVSKILTNSILDGIGTVLGISEEDIKEYRKNHD